MPGELLRSGAPSPGANRSVTGYPASAAAMAGANSRSHPSVPWSFASRLPRPDSAGHRDNAGTFGIQFTQPEAQQPIRVFRAGSRSEPFIATIGSVLFNRTKQSPPIPVCARFDDREQRGGSTAASTALPPARSTSIAASGADG